MHHLGRNYIYKRKQKDHKISDDICDGFYSFVII